jgi:hypothetical protein
MKDWPEQKQSEKDGVVEGKDAQGAADVEVAGAMGVASRVEEDAGDEES